jgi:hypothetical protein
MVVELNLIVVITSRILFVFFLWILVWMLLDFVCLKESLLQILILSWINVHSILSIVCSKKFLCSVSIATCLLVFLLNNH